MSTLDSFRTPSLPAEPPDNFLTSLASNQKIEFRFFFDASLQTLPDKTEQLSVDFHVSDVNAFPFPLHDLAKLFANSSFVGAGVSAHGQRSRPVFQMKREKLTKIGSTAVPPFQLHSNTHNEFVVTFENAAGVSLFNSHELEVFANEFFSRVSWATMQRFQLGEDQSINMRLAHFKEQETQTRFAPYSVHLNRLPSLNVLAVLAQQTFQNLDAEEKRNFVPDFLPFANSGTDNNWLEENSAFQQLVTRLRKWKTFGQPRQNVLHQFIVGSLVVRIILADTSPKLSKDNPFENSRFAFGSLKHLLEKVAVARSTSGCLSSDTRAFRRLRFLLNSMTKNEVTLITNALRKKNVANDDASNETLGALASLLSIVYEEFASSQETPRSFLNQLDKYVKALKKWKIEKFEFENSDELAPFDKKLAFQLLSRKRVAERAAVSNSDFVLAAKLGLCRIFFAPSNIATEDDEEEEAEEEDEEYEDDEVLDEEYE